MAAQAGIAGIAVPPHTMRPTPAPLALALSVLAFAAQAQTADNPVTGKALFENTPARGKAGPELPGCHGSVEARRSRQQYRRQLCRYHVRYGVARFTAALATQPDMRPLRVLTNQQVRDIAVYIADTPKTTPESESQLNFSAALNGNSAAQTVSLKHSTAVSENLQITSVAAVGTGAANFVLAKAGCEGVTLAPAGTCSITVTYAPTTSAVSTPDLVFTMKQGASTTTFERVLFSNGSIASTTPPATDSGGGGASAWAGWPRSARRWPRWRATPPDQAGTTAFAAAPREHRRQGRAGVAGRHAHQRLGRALRDDAAAALATLGAEVDDPVRLGDHVEVVLDHHHAVPAVDQPVQHADQLFHVGHVQADRRLVQHVQRVRGSSAPGRPKRTIPLGGRRRRRLGADVLAAPGHVVAHLRQLGHQLDALRLAAAQRRRRLAQRQVAQADVVQQPQRVRDLRHRGLVPSRSGCSSGMAGNPVAHARDRSAQRRRLDEAEGIVRARRVFTAVQHFTSEIRPCSASLLCLPSSSPACLPPAARRLPATPRQRPPMAFSSARTA
jgi:hypothetical protein